MDKQLNNFLTSIGDNTIKNEITSMSIVQRNNELFQEGKFKVNNDSIYSMLGIKAPNQILTETRGFETVDRINMERKRLVDRIILPLANFKNLVETFLENYKGSAYSDSFLEYYGSLTELMVGMINNDDIECIDFRVPDYPDWYRTRKNINELFYDYI